MEVIANGLLLIREESICIRNQENAIVPQSSHRGTTPLNPRVHHVDITSQFNFITVLSMYFY